MDRLGDIIFFVLIAIVVGRNVIAFLKRKSEPEETQRPIVFPDLSENKQTISPIEIKNKTAPVLTEKKLKTNQKNEKTPIPENNALIDFSDSSELKKAVIYSEIFNRKYS